MVEKILGAIILLAILSQVQLFFHIKVPPPPMMEAVDNRTNSLSLYHKYERKKTKSISSAVVGVDGKGKKNDNNLVLTTVSINNNINNNTNKDKQQEKSKVLLRATDRKDGGDTNNGSSNNGKRLLNPNFKKYDNVAIVSKIHHPEDIFRVKKMLCFCMAAYNQYVNYDVVIFMTMPFTEEHVEDLRQAVAPSNLVVARDGPSLEEHLASMTEDERTFLFNRCNLKQQKDKQGEKSGNLTWYSHCKERDSNNVSNLAYSWQSEFRAYHIYHHEALSKYKYMVWFDSDVQCAEPWKVDPVETMVKNDLAILFYNFPYGRVKNNLIRQKMKNAYGRQICGLRYDKHLLPSYCRSRKEKVKINQIHGFHHITNLDFYRNETQQKLLKDMVSEYKFSRMWDDQIGVTLPAALGAPEKSWSYHDHGLGNITILHKEKPVINTPGRIRDTKYDLRKYWYEEGGREKLPGGEKCDAFLTMH